MTGISGIVPILLTPFDHAGRIDDASLAAEIDETLAAEVHGIGIAIGSEIFKLLPEERRALVRLVVDRVAGRVPVVVNTSANGTALAVALALEAHELGADRLMIWPPHFFPAGPDAVAAHMEAVSRAVPLPIILQDIPQSPINAALALRIAASAPSVDAIKVETVPTVGQVGAMVAAAGDRLIVLGGAGGGTLIEEHRRGGRGTMPFASQAREFMALWRCLESGDYDGARTIMDTQIMPIARIAAQGGDLFYHMHKALLVRRGIFATSNVRAPTLEPDKTTRAEMEAALPDWPSRGKLIAS